MTKSKSSVRSRRASRQASERRRRQLTIGLAVIGVLAVIGLFAWAGQPKPPEVVVLPESLEPPPNADGSAWGPSDAAVLVEEFGDFQ